MKALLLLATPCVALATPAAAQTMDHSNMPGMKMPPQPVAKPRAAAGHGR